jgi:hypothetical protein
MTNCVGLQRRPPVWTFSLLLRFLTDLVRHGLYQAVSGDGVVVDMDFEWRVVDPVLGTVDAGGLFTAATNVPNGHSQRTTVIAGGIYNGRLYADFAMVRVTRE